MLLDQENRKRFDELLHHVRKRDKLGDLAAELDVRRSEILALMEQSDEESMPMGVSKTHYPMD